MKKALLILLALVMVFSVVACSGGDKGDSDKGGAGDGGDKVEKDALQIAIETYDLDMESTEKQPMSDERATVDQLKSLKVDYFKGTMSFAGTEFEDVTYGDIKDELGVDASYYYLNDSNPNIPKQCFVWLGDGDDNAMITICFTDGKLNILTSQNLS